MLIYLNFEHIFNIFFMIFFLSLDRVAVITFGIITLIAGVILSSVPWLNYFILKVRDRSLKTKKM